MRTAWPASAILFSSLLASGLGWAANPNQAASPSFAGGAQAPSSPANSTAQEIQTLRQIEANYLRAEMENNPTLAETILADDYIGIRDDGGTADKSEVLNSLARSEPGRAPYSIEAASMREWIFGDTACVTYTKIYTVPSRHAAYQENVLHVFTKRNGSWHLQVSSPLPEPHPHPAATK